MELYNHPSPSSATNSDKGKSVITNSSNMASMYGNAASVHYSHAVGGEAWFKQLSPLKQAAYMKLHPNSHLGKS